MELLWQRFAQHRPAEAHADTVARLRAAAHSLFLSLPGWRGALDRTASRGPGAAAGEAGEAGGEAGPGGLPGGGAGGMGGLAETLPLVGRAGLGVWGAGAYGASRALPAVWGTCVLGDGRGWGPSAGCRSLRRDVLGGTQLGP